MKAGDIQRCALCGEGVMRQGVPLFWHISLTRMGVDLAAVAQVQGMETMMQGHVALARVFADPDIATPLGEARTVLVCEGCAGEATSVYRLGLGG